MYKIETIADYILGKQGEMSAMKLQKLLYYTQAWSLVWDDKPLFDARIEAWANGPVAPELYAKHRGEFSIRKDRFENSRAELDASAKETVDSVLGYYADKSAHWLSELTHAERPWREARADVPAGERSSVEITHAAMGEYYGSLTS